MDYLIDFSIEAGAGLVGVFAGAALALWADRRARRQRSEEARARQREDLANSRSLVISSVVKNTAQARRLVSLIEDGSDPYLFQITLESAVWEATRAEFVRIASVDERVLLTRFFDHVRRMDRLVDFHRQVRANLEVRESAPDSGDRQLVEGLREQLQEIANDIRIDGLVIVTDLGDPMHKRLLGIEASQGEKS